MQRELSVTFAGELMLRLVSETDVLAVCPCLLRWDLPVRWNTFERFMKISDLILSWQGEERRKKERREGKKRSGFGFNFVKKKTVFRRVLEQGEIYGCFSLFFQRKEIAVVVWRFRPSFHGRGLVCRNTVCENGP